MEKIGVIGAGTMGRGIAQIAAQNGHKVVLQDLSKEVLNKAESFIARMIDRSVEQGRRTIEERAQILGSI